MPTVFLSQKNKEYALLLMEHLKKRIPPDLEKKNLER